ncbi:RPAP1-like protein [Echria macrotheca]|uniref:RPAP1-like protein n=1 Tax=Echria macrotheca TaxID=438768 RepID=A0AAJ0BHG1_9PEZI|nr:RPAP1-like protein [Echria macrotheca]
MEATLRVNDITERATGEPKPPSFPTPQSSTASGFPAHKKRTSAFKQRRQAQSQTGQPENGGPSSVRKDAPGRLATTPEDAEAAERRRIDEENRATLAAMSPEDIIEAQRDLFSALDPTTIQMLLRRATLDEKPRGPDPFAIPSPEEAPPKSDPPEIKIEDADHPKAAPPPPPSAPETIPTRIETQKTKKTVTFDEDAPPPVPPADLFPISSPPPKAGSAAKTQHAGEHGTTHFPPPPQVPDLDPSDPDFLSNLHRKFFPSLPADPSKLAWMAPLPTEDSPADRDSPYYPGRPSLAASALRFDFRGALLGPRTSRAIPVTKGLHHHGEAPEAAGYTIPELARLARSAVPAQRCIAYQTLGRMLYRLGRGEWGVGAGGREGDEDDLAFALWRLFRDGKVLESLEEEAGREDGVGHASAKAYAVEALWLFQKGGWKEKWRGL